MARQVNVTCPVSSGGAPQYSSNACICVFWLGSLLCCGFGFHVGCVCAGDAGLRKHFENAVSSVGGSVRSVKVAMRKGPDGKALSMGFGFVECSSEDVAKAVLKQLQVRPPMLCSPSLLIPLLATLV